MEQSRSLRIGGSEAQTCMVGVMLLLVGCSSEATSGIPIPNGTEGVATPDDVVMIVFRNIAVAEAVDVEFYATTNPVENLPDDLFVPENMVSAYIGVAGTGIVRPGTVDWIEHPCTDDLVIGTAGGTFSDNESGELRGTGDRRWAEATALGLCGSVVTFVFAGEGETFGTTVDVGW